MKFKITVNDRGIPIAICNRDTGEKINAGDIEFIAPLEGIPLLKLTIVGPDIEIVQMGPIEKADYEYAQEMARR